MGQSHNRLIELRNKQKPLSETIAEHQAALAKYQEVRIPGADRQYYAGQITRGGMTHQEAEKTGRRWPTARPNSTRTRPRLPPWSRSSRRWRRSAVNWKPKRRHSRSKIVSLDALDDELLSKSSSVIQLARRGASSATSGGFDEERAKREANAQDAIRGARRLDGQNIGPGPERGRKGQN